MIEFARRANDVLDRLARHLADEADQDFLHGAIRARWQQEAQARIDAWLREPREPANDTERLCEEARQNHQAMNRARAERAEARQALREAQEAQGAPDPSITTLSLKDAVTGHLFRVTLPADKVERIMVGRLAM